MSDITRILIVEDDADFCFLINSMINREPQMEVAGNASNCEEAVRLARLLAPDIVLMDLNLSSTSLDGIDASRAIRLCTNAKVIILTAFENPQITLKACKEAFACAYVFKSQFSMLSDTIHKAASGFTPQEQMIHALTLSDLSAAEHSVFRMMLGENINLKSTPKTIYNQKAALLKKLNLKSQSELVHLFGGMRFN